MLDKKKLHRGEYTAEERFWDKVEKTDTCWLWTGAGVRYGSFNADEERAHRFSWTIHYGEIPAGLNVLHKCDVTFCVNPEHLFLGTQKDNVDDMIEKERYRGGWSKEAQLKGLAVSNSTPVECPECSQIIGNVAALGTHMKFKH